MFELLIEENFKPNLHKGPKSLQVRRASGAKGLAFFAYFGVKKVSKFKQGRATARASKGKGEQGEQGWGWTRVRASEARVRTSKVRTRGRRAISWGRWPAEIFSFTSSSSYLLRFISNNDSSLYWYLTVTVNQHVFLLKATVLYQLFFSCSVILYLFNHLD